MVVCTLCSCYPKAIIGVPPAWYKSSAYRARAVLEPRKVLAEFGSVVPDDVEVHVHDSNADLRFIVLPMRPAGTEHLGEAELAAMVTRDSLIGVAPPRAA
jgi:nitrile hydratase